MRQALVAPPGIGKCGALKRHGLFSFCCLQTKTAVLQALGAQLPALHLHLHLLSSPLCPGSTPPMPQSFPK